MKALLLLLQVLLLLTLQLVQLVLQLVQQLVLVVQHPRGPVQRQVRGAQGRVHPLPPEARRLLGTHNQSLHESLDYTLQLAVTDKFQEKHTVKNNLRFGAGCARFCNF